MGAAFAEVCNSGACRKGVPKKRKKPKKVTSTDDGVGGDAAVVAGPLAITLNHSPPACQEATETSSAAPAAVRQHGSDDPAGSPAASSRDADTASLPGCSDCIAHSAPLHDPALSARGAAACAASDGDGDDGAAAKPNATLVSSAAISGDRNAPRSSADGVAIASATAATVTVAERRPARPRMQEGIASNAGPHLGSTPRACEMDGSAADASQPPAALPSARMAQDASGHGAAAGRVTDDQPPGAGPQREANARLATTSAVTAGTRESDIAGLRPASSEDSEPQAAHEPRGTAAAGPRAHQHMRSLSRVSVGSTVSSGVSEHPSHGATALDPDPSQEAVDAARTYLAAVAAEASLAVGSMHLFAETLGAWLDARVAFLRSHARWAHAAELCDGLAQWRSTSWSVGSRRVRGHDMISVGLCAERVDGAIETAARLSISTKYAKKVRRRLLSSLDEPQPGEPDPQTSATAAVIDPPAPSTPPAAAGGGSGAPFGPATADARRDNPSDPPRSNSRAAVPRDALLPAEVQPRAADAAPAVSHHGALLAALLPRAKPKPAPMPDSRTNGHALAHVATNGVRREPSSTPTVRICSCGKCTKGRPAGCWNFA